ncbi:hypothetical protein [Streptomyces bohaiensis]|uniref:hypothetical protein n=1 Tax=Streptomyces bohaiensis TaxID=1431344 RepID=UPI003B7C7750
MIIALVVAAEIGFWLVLGAGLAARYLLHRPRAGAALLLCVPLIDVLLLTATAVDLARGAEPGPRHVLAALYLGFTVAYGHRLIRWADAHAAHRAGRGPRPAKPPARGRERIRLELVLWRQTVVAAALAAVVLQMLTVVAADGARADEALGNGQALAVRIAVVHGVIALSALWWARPRPGERSGGRPGPTGDTGGSGPAGGTDPPAGAGAPVSRWSPRGAAPQRFSPGTHSTSPVSLLAARARMNSRSERRLR